MTDRYRRRAGLVIPERETRQVDAGGVGETGEEVFNGGRLAVVALEIQVHAGTEAAAPQERLQHAADLGPLFVDGGRVEVVDLAVSGRTDRMGEGARILR